jgi:hypothetical protein
VSSSLSFQLLSLIFSLVFSVSPSSHCEHFNSANIASLLLKVAKSGFVLVVLVVVAVFVLVILVVVVVLVILVVVVVVVVFLVVYLKVVLLR